MYKGNHYIITLSLVNKVHWCSTVPVMFLLHTARILTKYLGSMKEYQNCLPSYIPHPFIEESKQKSVLLNS